MKDEINLLDYWWVIVKRKWLIIGLTVVTAFSALVFSLRQPKLYKATATIMTVEGGGGGLASALAAVPFLGRAGGGGGESRLIPILKSATLAKQVAQDIDLQEYFPKLYKELDDKEKIANAGESLRGAVGARSSGGLLAISIVWTSPEAAAELANYYVEQLGKFLNRRSLNVNFQVIDPAVPPKSKFKPLIRQNVMIGGILGLFMGVFIAFSLEYLKSLHKA